MKTSFVVPLSVVCIVFTVLNHANASNNEFIPTSAPIPMTPSAAARLKTGYGYNVVNLRAEWKEDLLTANKEEIGDIDYESRNIVFGIQKKNSESTAVEYDIVIGTVDGESAQDSYFSPTLNKTADIEMNGDGWDIGARIIYCRCLYEQKDSTGGKFIDWNAGLSLHFAFFSIDEHYFAETRDGASMTEYDETITGIYARPAVAIQPVIYIADRLKLNPYLGLDARLSFYNSDWEETDGHWSGFTWEQIKSYGYDPTGSETVSDIAIGRGLVGMDISILINKRYGHELNIGAVISKLLGGASSDFSEAHVLYSIEL